MRVILDVIQGPKRGRSFIFDRHDTFVVGRSRFVHCPLPEDSALSRDHFLIEVNPPRCELRDLNSTNGTFVNGRRVERARLDSEDRISAGQSVFRVRVEGVPALQVAEFTPAPGARPESAILGPDGQPILCIVCGTVAPRDVEIARGSWGGAGDTVDWLCELCRSDVDLAPQHFGRYTTLRELGRGMMGIVYLAQHQETGKKVALKVIVPEFAATRSAMERFHFEMTVISRMKHVNIVEWLEQGIERGRFWFAMEYISGSNLERMAIDHAGTYPIYQACRMACQVLKGLEYAHCLGYVHRDIKPENILIGRSPTGLVAKISDFGLAKSFRGIGLAGLTFSGEMRGTIPFMPPEQMLDFRTVQPSGDLYATAATLYYLITGSFIYDQVDESGDLIRKLLEENPVPIQRRRPEVPTGLAVVLERCLARDPQDRFPTASDMRQALRAFC